MSAHLAAASFEYFSGRISLLSPARVRVRYCQRGADLGGILILDNLGRALARLSRKWYEGTRHGSCLRSIIPLPPSGRK